MNNYIIDKNNSVINESNNINDNNSIANNLNDLQYIDEFNIWDIKTVFKYVISKPIEFLLLLLVFVIIYFVDYISRINASIYGMSQSIPFFGQSSQQMQSTFIQKDKKRRNK